MGIVHSYVTMLVYQRVLKIHDLQFNGSLLLSHIVYIMEKMVSFAGYMHVPQAADNMSKHFDHRIYPLIRRDNGKARKIIDNHLSGCIVPYIGNNNPN